MKIKFSKWYMYYHLGLSFIVQKSCGEIFMVDINKGGFILPLFSIVVINILQFLFVRSLFHFYKLNHRHTKLLILECISAVGFVVYNMLCSKLVFVSGTVYFGDILVSLIFAIPFILSMAKIEE